MKETTPLKKMKVVKKSNANQASVSKSDAAWRKYVEKVLLISKFSSSDKLKEKKQNDKKYCNFNFCLSN